MLCGYLGLGRPNLRVAGPPPTVPRQGYAFSRQMAEFVVKRRSLVVGPWAEALGPRAPLVHSSFKHHPPYQHPVPKQVLSNHSASYDTGTAGLVAGSLYTYKSAFYTSM